MFEREESDSVFVVIIIIIILQKHQHNFKSTDTLLYIRDKKNRKKRFAFNADVVWWSSLYDRVTVSFFSPKIKTESKNQEQERDGFE